MRAPLSLVIVATLALAAVANAQTAVVAQPAVTPAAPRPAAALASEPVRAHAARQAHPRHAPSRRAAASAHATAPAGKSGSVLSLGASDITGNKELPKVMVIVPWKDSLGAGGVVKPTDSLLDEVLQPVDRAVFQRRIRYYGQLDGGGEQTAAGDSANGARKSVAPVGDSH